jgi:decaprenylphospho-beta-D-ribofuranose 2-oxidase
VTAAPGKTAGAGTPRVVRQALSGWGRYPVAECLLARPERMRDAVPPADPCIPRGQGRSYGDAAVSTGHTVLLMERLNRFRAFVPRRGVLTVEAGVTVGEVQRVAVPRGWTLAVTPGTRHATVGGCVAADVHGKNHHQDGGFGAFVNEITLVTADGAERRCGPDRDPDLFHATLGGMGLTGLVTEVTLRLVPVRSAYVRVTHHPARNLDGVLDLLDGEPGDAPYSVAWIDCLCGGAERGRGIVMAGRHAEPDEVPGGEGHAFRTPSRRRLALPFDAPSRTLNRRTVGLFNALYYRRHAGRRAPEVVDYDRFFYPLDGIAAWNRLYGRPGLVQYQCVLPTAEGRDGLHEVLSTLHGARIPAFLGVLKKLGAQGAGLLSFPMAGYTLAVDIPLSAPGALACAARLDAVVTARGGRVYLAKDACLDAARMPQMYPRLEAWREVKRKVDPQGRFRSDLGTRLGLVEAG